MQKKLLFAAIACTLAFVSCEKSDETYKSAPLSDYYPLQVGKYVTYRLDSLVHINFGTKDTTKTYQVKHLIDAQVTDNLGRPAYRIIRYIRQNATQAWTPDNTFLAVPTELAVEFIENNMRFLKMKLPIREGFTWKGNSYIDTYSLNSDVKYLDDWDYMYDSLNVPAVLGTLTVDSTLKVFQRDEVIGNPNDPNSYSEINKGEEKYAKGIGMVYRFFQHTEYQPPTPGRGGYKQGYGVRFTMIDHN